MTEPLGDFFASFSGGKDSTLALYRALKAGGRARALLCMLHEGGQHSRSHGLPLRVLQRQAHLMGVPLYYKAASWEGYEQGFLQALKELKTRGIRHGVFGDIELQAHRDWVERVCAQAGITPHLPLWGQSRQSLLGEFFSAGFSALIVAVKDGVLEPQRFLGRRLSPSVLAQLQAQGVDACGEQGEFHTLVLDGPIFSAPLEVAPRGHVLRNGYWFLRL